MRWILAVVLFSISMIGIAGSQAISIEKKEIEIVCGHLLDEKTERDLGKSIISVKDGKIAAVTEYPGRGRVFGYDPKTQELVNLDSHTCLPGLIDTHTHILLQGDITAADYDEQLLNSRRSIGRFWQLSMRGERWSMGLRPSAISRPKARDMRTWM